MFVCVSRRGPSDDDDDGYAAADDDDHEGDDDEGDDDVDDDDDNADDDHIHDGCNVDGDCGDCGDCHYDDDASCNVSEMEMSGGIAYYGIAWYCILFGLIARYHTVMYCCYSAPANYRQR